ncbi:MAG: hypothetical protein J07HR59_01005 [Halorubrum sp. J07HR59]|nr:MAG: hypothetical protein J07HR59_01005 [Halorubrum sp. J07HR59]
MDLLTLLATQPRFLTTMTNQAGSRGLESTDSQPVTTPGETMLTLFTSSRRVDAVDAKPVVETGRLTPGANDTSCERIG